MTTLNPFLNTSVAPDPRRHVYEVSLPNIESDGTRAYAMFRGYVGYIGRDQQYFFQQHLTDLSDRPLRLREKNFYVPIIAQPQAAVSWWVRLVAQAWEIAKFVFQTIFFFFCDKPTPLNNPPFDKLPSSLFTGAQHGSHLHFKWDGRPIELIIKQEAFDKVLKAAAAYAQYNSLVYLYDSDRPPNWLRFERRILSSDAVLIQHTISSADKDKLMTTPSSSYQADRGQVQLPTTELLSTIESTFSSACSPLQLHSVTYTPQQTTYLFTILNETHVDVIIDRKFVFIGVSEDNSSRQPRSIHMHLSKKNIDPQQSYTELASPTLLKLVLTYRTESSNGSNEEIDHGSGQ